jgi:hypothetical protein
MRAYTCLCLFVLFIAAEVCGQIITKLDPKSGAVGTPIKITGTAFGTDGTVEFNGTSAKTIDWSNSSIIAVVPPGAKSGDVVVTAGSTKSPGSPFTVKSSEYDQSAFEVLTGVGAVLSGAEATSYKTNNDALSSTNVGRKTPEILLGGGFILPWKWGGHQIENSYCPPDAPNETPTENCKAGGAYRDYRPWEAFLSIRFAPATDQTINGFVLGGGYRITKYFSVMVGYSVTPVDEPSPGFRVAAAQTVSASPAITPYNRYNASDLLRNKPGAFDGFPLFLYNATGVTTTKIFSNSPTVTHHRSGIYFGVGIPLNLTALFKPSGAK